MQAHLTTMPTVHNVRVKLFKVNCFYDPNLLSLQYLMWVDLASHLCNEDSVFMMCTLPVKLLNTCWNFVLCLNIVYIVNAESMIWEQEFMVTI